MPGRSTDVDVLVVGAGPTGLALASQLVRFGTRVRIIDKQIDRHHESRALGVQARTLEILQVLGLGEELVSRGRSTTRLKLHVDPSEILTIDLGRVDCNDTRFPFILFVSQQETEAVLTDHLVARGVAIERSAELTSVHPEPEKVTCVVQRTDGQSESITANYVVGCDGAHSTVRKAAAILYEGGAYSQHFVLGDVEADGLEVGGIHAFAGGRGVAIFFPLGRPTTWRVIAIEAGEPAQSDRLADQEVTTHPLSLPELQAIIDAPTFASVRLRDAAWLTRFRLHHRQASHYRSGRMFLAGDAAHIHSPVGAQGMNTGIQDAWNLGWKLALVTAGRAEDRLLESYHAERWPVGRTLLRVTDRIFGVIAKSASGGQVMESIRRLLLRGIVAPAMSRPKVRALAFHFVSQLGIHYRRSPIVREAEPRLEAGPRAGDRLPDSRVESQGFSTYLQQALASPRLQALLCGPRSSWDENEVATLLSQFPDLLSVRYLSPNPDSLALFDVEGRALAQLGVKDRAQYLVRPDGHIAFRCAGADLSNLASYLAESFR